MERPICRTCPYWDLDTATKDLGSCLRFPPVLVPSDSLAVEWRDVDSNPFLGCYPETDGFLTCGEHPDFPAYIESLKAARE